MRRRQIRVSLCRAPMTSPFRTKSLIPRFQEKPLSFSCDRTVPQSDTGRQGENPKALERTRVKELGNIAP
jgi:hypothetical protein